MHATARRLNRQTAWPVGSLIAELILASSLRCQKALRLFPVAPDVVGSTAQGASIPAGRGGQRYRSAPAGDQQLQSHVLPGLDVYGQFQFRGWVDGLIFLAAHIHVVERLIVACACQDVRLVGHPIRREDPDRV